MNFIGKRKKLRCLLHTFGCQMNAYDSEVAEGTLRAAGYEVMSEGDAVERKSQKVKGEKRGQAYEQNELLPVPFFAPDIILMNTCSVREHAEERVIGRLGMLGKLKRTNPDLIVGLMGCMVEEHREKLFKRFPVLDLMVGTRNIKQLPNLIEQVIKTRKQVAQIKQDGISIEYTELISRKSKFHAWLPIMTGCNKKCTFCVVPKTRGTEISMPADEVVREAGRLIREGVKWITLLGQNVNSYKGDVCVGAGLKPASTFSELLESLCHLDGDFRISFITSHPHDATEELFRVIAKNPKISRHFHLPLQSGSDQILKRMGRQHTYPEYKRKVDRLRELVPDIAITTDIITGFPGEAEEDYQATVNALKEICFDGAFIFKYSARPETPAAKLKDDVPFAVKNQRNHELLKIQKQMTDDNNQKRIGKVSEVFVEGLNERNPKQVIGCSIHEKKVVFFGDRLLVGAFCFVRFNEIKHETFIGETTK
ncbi:MAG: tRNA (N6-isopentenyl adenosine(37)-C2)-methylthiotransferase MiaB [Omnitrophica bacterium RIFCSPLOWO2_12_FULL_44_17]|uniref:tRNA-2-methylthio-N(6)-dimethylallyladenosine synthase n=1 Tax=Candidatus Danuiimicrobium aquiferis TaxID=1801832 RepID=A0A1G1KSW3_9BACT|nr:MAG: tRNA (N6-isopentenyl adenosine(37)-C2)-methylthiotransferase MiaB [Omnitrophica bacterium RIFCSPHIGHO2_02_FULL_45_28]OGW88809.1 MAG: tRNA (N6-isopentenyl adenosine(37)-C2)-methylthiotransferase MiaB [Omnitrophica bacterium RIFCSPHIGHO2_12_FULL_44_12]OGW96018.1 MAG: tRNA (N6-isopentenyl adenosine(37)-C2)-methylthiotransferase MiaB [Omnitrophica bacterium RIFCSPLOWO2_12_FULL_44_17]